MKVLLFELEQTISSYFNSSGPYVAPTVVTHGQDAGHYGVYAHNPSDDLVLGFITPSSPELTNTVTPFKPNFITSVENVFIKSLPVSLSYYP